MLLLIWVHISPHAPIKEIEITEQGVLNLLTNHKPHKLPGPDDIGASFLRNTATEIASMLTHLFQQSLYSGVLRTTGLETCLRMYLLFIRRVARQRNYRPVLLTSLICEVMEHILVSQIMKHLESNNILSQVQYGFRSRHSCEA